MRVLAQLWLFFRRDLAIARTYRAAFLLEATGTLFGAAMIYYVARLVDSPALSLSLPQGGSYFAFALVGFAFFDYLGVALDTFDRSLDEARSTATLEPLLTTQVSLPVVLAGSAIFPFLVTTLRVAIYLGWGGALFGLPLGKANWFGVVAVLLASILAFSGLGILSAGYLLLFKRGNPAKWFLLGVSGLASGMLFPVAILPAWLQFLARLNPVTYALDAARRALLAGTSLRELLRPITALLLFAAILLPGSIGAFAAALRRTKATGTLTHI